MSGSRLSIRSLVAALVASAALTAAPRAALAQVFHTGTVTDSGSTQVGGTITYDVTVTSVDATKQIVVAARDSQDPSTPGSLANPDYLEWTGTWSGSDWTCNPALSPGTPICFYLPGFLPVGSSTPPLTLVFAVHQPTAPECWSLSGAQQVPGPCAEMRIADVGYGGGGPTGPLGGGQKFTPVLSDGVTHWREPLGSSWFSPAAWTNGVPGAGDVAHFSIPGTHPVFIDVALDDARARSVSVDAGAVRLQLVNADVFCLFPRCYERPNLVVTDRVDVAGSAELVITTGNLITPALYLPAGASIEAQGGALVVGGTTEQLPGTIDLLAGGIVQLCSLTQLDAAVVNNAGHVPGSCSPNTLQITGDFTQTATGTLEVELASPGPSDLYVVGGTATLDGVLELRALTSPESLEHQTFHFLQAGEVSGAFAEIRNLTGVNLTLDLAAGQIETGVAHVPQADAGPDERVGERGPVTLDGSGSSDPDGDALTYQWLQVPGPHPVTLDLSDPVHPTFLAPEAGPPGLTLSFTLEVDDGGLTSEPDTVVIVVSNVDHGPIGIGGCGIGPELVLLLPALGWLRRVRRGGVVLERV
jgi:hypothetical protein